MTGMDPISVDGEVRLIPWYPNEETALSWYQDPELVYQVDGVAQPYTPEKLRRMYEYLCAQGDCFYIEYRGELVGDIALKRDGEICVVVARPWQNLHIGRRCVEAIMRLAAERGLSRVRARIYGFNLQSQRMFAAAGFAPEGGEWYARSVTP